MSVEQEMRELLKGSLAKVKELKAQLAASEGARSEPIAIIGMGCRFPDGAHSPEDFWKLLDEGRDAVQPLAPRWELVGAEPAADAPRWAGLLTAPLDSFDAAFFEISPREARSLDPQQRLVLEVAWEALENAGLAPDTLHGGRTGVFLGAYNTDYLDAVERLPREEQDVYGVTGNLLNVLAGRLSYTLGLQGPCLTVDTACSSSLVAVHLACRSLRDRESNLALAGGVSLILSPKMMEAVGRTQALAPDGRCKTFDASANGFARGEGCGLVVLKRLSDAQRDGDHVWALIRSSVMNQDGRSTGLTAPSVLAQQALLREALHQARVQPENIGYVETHGTGTSLGDPIEVEALRAVVGSPRADGSKCVLGAVKTNLGHLEAAAGVAGLIKSVLTLHHERVPKNLHFSTQNPRLRMQGTALALATESSPWPRGTSPRFAGVSSFGISGTNAHLVLEEAPTQELAPSVPMRSAELLVLSAKSEDALKAQAARLKEHLDAHPEAALGDVALSLATTRSPLEHRLALVATSRAELAEALREVAQGELPAGAVRGRAEAGSRPKIVFVFPGQGSQWLGMGRKLLLEEPVFRAAIQACDSAIQAEAGWSLLTELQADEATSRLGRIDVVQPVLFAMEVALAALWRSWDVTPDVVIGHSMGETAAAYVAGALSLEDAVRVICRRSQLLLRISGQGEMAMVELTTAEAAAALRGHEDVLSVAVSNSPRSTVISGDPAALAKVLSTLEARSVFCRRVKVDVASHSPQVEPLRESLRAALRELQPRDATVAMFSTVTGAWVRGPELSASYWMDNLRQPVRFAESVQALLGDGQALFVELSPHPILTAAIEEICGAAAQPGVAVGSLRRDKSERAVMLESLGALWAQGHSVAWARLFPSGGRRVPLPTYPWQRERYWVPTPAGEGKAAPGRKHSGGHPLLGEALEVSSQSGKFLWESTLDPKRISWLADHQVQKVVVFPGAGYLEMALAAGAAIFDQAPVVVTEVTFVETMVFAGDVALAVQLVTNEEAAGRVRFTISSRVASAAHASWTVHCRGLLRRAEKTPESARREVASVRARLGTAVPGSATYAALAERGLDYGPAFQGVHELWRRSGEALGRVQLPEAVGAADAYQIHPALMDACFQVMAGAFGDEKKAALMPVELGLLRLIQRPEGELWCHAHFLPTDQQKAVSQAPGRWSADLWVTDGTGAVVVEISGLVVQELARRAPRSEQDDWFLELSWEPAPAPLPQVHAGRFLLLGDGGGLGAALRSALEAAGHTTVQAVVGAPGSVVAGCLLFDDSTPAGVRALLGEAFAGQAPSAVVSMRSLEGKGPMEGPALETAIVRGYDSVLSTVQALAATGYRDAPRLWLVTRGAQAVGGDDVVLDQAPLLGLGRTIAMEHPELRCTRVDSARSGTADEVSALLAELLSAGAEEEIALRGGVRHVARIIHKLPEAANRARTEPAGRRPFRLEIDKPGIIDDLVLRASTRRAPGPGEVEIVVEAAGLNFLDVLLALGVMPNDGTGAAEGPIVFGGECVGRIAAVGEGVTSLAVGQSVIALAQGAISSHVTANAALVLERPAEYSATEAAALPAVYLTAWYALERVARLQKGERVLIHAATGGVGLAAVQWAQHVGAEIYATAGSPEKRAYLESLGVRYVSDSRSDRFVADIRAWTNGEGVDVVLNSLSGELLSKSFDLLRDHGRFVELGKRDYYANHPLGLRPFLRNLSFSLVDLRGMLLKQPERTRALFQELLDLVRAGILRPPPIAAFPISRAAEAFRKMAQAQHIGKLVLTMDDPEARIEIPSPHSPIRRDASYLVTGGLGGLGLRIAGWLAAQGAGQLVLMGRSGAVSAEQRAAIAAIEAQGTRVRVAQADVASGLQLAPIFAEIAASNLPLAGVIHAAVVLEDGLLAQQTSAGFRRVMAPKISGAWQLHQLTRELPLDFFVMYSSASGLFGSPGQGNYAAANTFLDSLAHHRRAQGLPALSIDWGNFSEVGLAAAQENRGARLESRGVRSFTPAQGHLALERLLKGSDAQVGVMQFDARQWAETYPSAASSSLLARLMAAQSGSATPPAQASALIEQFATVKPGERISFLIGVVRAEVARVLRIPESKLDVNTRLIRLGLDSLMGLELKHRLKRITTVDVPVVQLLGDMTLSALARLLSTQVAGASAPPTETPKDSNWLDTEL